MPPFSTDVLAVLQDLAHENSETSVTPVTFIQGDGSVIVVCLSGPAIVVRGSLPLVSADQLHPHDNVPVHGLSQVGPGVPGQQGNERVEGAKRKGVAVGRARR